MTSLLLDQRVETEKRLIVDSDIRMSEIIAALSAALDITEGQPPGHAARSCLIGMRIGRQIGMEQEDLSDLFYALLLKDLGCSSNAAKMCYLFGADDRTVKHDLKTVNWQKAWQCLRFSWKRVAQGGSTIQKVLRMAAMAKEGEKGARKLVETRCERGADIVRMLQLPDATAQAVRNLDEHWNGRGHPDGLKGEEIPLMARIACLAQTVEVFFAADGKQAAIEVAQTRRGKWFDPQLVDALQATETDEKFWETLAADDLQHEVSKCEPPDRQLMADDAAIDRVACAFARVVDAKSPWTHKHSEGVAEIASGVARELGFSATMQHDIWRAGLLHDVGKLGVSNLILDKPGRPTDEEFAQIRKHPDYSHQILKQVRNFACLAEVAASHHERLDGNGYFRGFDADDLPYEARILAVADVWEALSARRPYRDEMPREKVIEIMQRDLGKAFCPDSFNALMSWQEKTNITPRVEAQLAEIERLLAEV